MKVFLSHSHRDDALASKLAGDLESVGVRVWYEGRDILPGDNWAEKIAEALADADAMIVLMSHNALESSSVKREVEYALGRKDYRYRVIPVLIGGEELLQEPSFPWILKKLNVVQLPEGEQSGEGLKRVVEALRQVA